METTVIDFNKGDVRRLYGKRLFLVPESDGVSVRPVETKAEEAVLTAEPTAEPVAVQPEPPTITSPKIEWALPTKPDARLTLVLRTNEYGDKVLIELLKNIVKALEIPFAIVNFGKSSKENMQLLTESDFEGLQTEIAFVFGYIPKQNPIKYKNKEIYFVPGLSEMHQDMGQKKIAWNLMKPLVSKLRVDK